MKKYYGHTLLYLHETISLGSGRGDRFTEVFTDTYQPMMDELGDILDGQIQAKRAAGAIAILRLEHRTRQRICRRLRQNRGRPGSRWQP